METTLKAWLQSSQDPSQVANKVKGAILMASGVIILAASVLFHITLTASDIVTLSSEVGIMAGALWTIYGCILHLVTWFGSVKAPVALPPQASA